MTTIPNEAAWRAEARLATESDKEITTLEHFWFEKGWVEARKKEQAEIGYLKDKIRKARLVINSSRAKTKVSLEHWKELRDAWLK